MGILEFLWLHRGFTELHRCDKMRKWQELILNSLLNFSMALVAGGILKLVLDKSSVIGSVIIAFCGAYLFVFFAILSIKFDKER